MLKNLLFLTGFGLFVVVAYILVNIFLEVTSTTIPPTIQKNLEPIEGSFNKKVLEQLKTRTVIPVDLASEAEIISSISASPTVPATTITPSPSRLP